MHFPSTKAGIGSTTLKGVDLKGSNGKPLKVARAQMEMLTTHAETLDGTPQGRAWHAMAPRDAAGFDRSLEVVGDGK
jgi:hypothetical protein